MGMDRVNWYPPASDWLTTPDPGNQQGVGQGEMKIEAGRMYWVANPSGYKLTGEA